MDRNQRWKDLAEAEALLPEVRQAGDRLKEGNVLAFIGTTYLLLGQVEEGLAALEQALEAFRAAHHAEGEELALRYCGSARVRAGQPTEAIPMLEEALSIARKRRDGVAIRDNLLHLGLASLSIQHWEQALAYLQESLTILRISGERGREVHVLNSLGHAFLGLGRLEECRACYESALALARELGSGDGEASALDHLGDLYTTWLDQPELGIEYLSQALAWFQRLGDSASEARSHLSLAAAQARAGRAEAALLHFTRARALAQELGNTVLLERVFAAMGKAYGHLGQPEEAIQFYERALSLSQRRHDRRHRPGDYLNDMGTLQLNRGAHVEAHLLYDQALAIARSTGERQEEAHQLENIAIALEQIGEEEAALYYYKQALALYQRLGKQAEEGVTCLSIGYWYEGQGRSTKCFAYLEMGRYLLEGTRLEVASQVVQHLEEIQARESEEAHRRALAQRQRYLRWLHLQRYWRMLGEPLGRWHEDGEEPALTPVGAPASQVLKDLGLFQAWQQGMEAVAVGRWETAVSGFEEILRLIREGHHAQTSLEAHALAMIGNARARLGNLNAGELAITEAHDLFRAGADQYNELATLFLLGSLMFQAGWMEEAIDYWDIARFTAKTYGEDKYRGMALRDIGQVCRDYYEDMREAGHCLEEALLAFQQAGDQLEEGETLLQLGLLCTELGYQRKAVQYHLRALDLLRATGVKPREAGQLLQLAAAHMVAGKFEDAAASLEQARVVYRDLDDRQHEARVEAMFGIGELLQGNTGGFLARLRAGLALVFEEGGKDREVLSRWLTHVTTMAEQAGKPSL